MQPSDHLFGTIKNGVLTLGAGAGASIRVRQDRLVIRDGGRERSFARATCPVSRIVVVRSEGFITFPAVRWITEIGAALVQLHYDGTPLLVTVSRSSVLAALRRVQASTTIDTRPGRTIAAALIGAKIAGQATTLQHFGHASAAAQVRALAERLEGGAPALDGADLLGVEGMAAVIYWGALADTELQFGHRQNAPDHWRRVGARRSSITGRPRGATTPGNAVLNYLYGVLCSEVTIALHTAGLEPFLGILHADKDERASLAYDLLEPARPILDRYFIHWLEETTFSARDFREDIHGFSRVTHPLNSHLAMTASLWRETAETLATWFVRALASGKPERLRLAPVEIEAEARNRARRWRTGNALQRPIPATCRECGKALAARRRKFCSAECRISFHGGKPVQAGLDAIARARAARAAAGVRETGAVSSITAVSVKDWRRSPRWSKARDEAMADWYRATVLPQLQREGGPRPTDIRRALGCGVTYSIEIKHDKRLPHPRLFAALAALVGVAMPVE